MTDFLPHPDYILMADCIYYEQVKLYLSPSTVHGIYLCI